MRESVREEIGVGAIETPPLMQCRADSELDAWHVEQMPADIDHEHPIRVFRVSVPSRQRERLLLVGGFHRLERIKREKRDTIWADVTDGTLQEAFLASRGENRKNGKGRTKQDVRHAAFQAFQARDEFGWKMTDASIAEALHVTAGRISQLNTEWRDTFKLKTGGDSAASSDGPKPEQPSNARTETPRVAQPTAPLPDIDAAIQEGRQLAEELQANVAQKQAPDLAVGVRGLLAEPIQRVVCLTTQLGWWEEAEPLLQPFLTWLQRKLVEA